MKNFNSINRSEYHSDRILDDFEGEEWTDIIGYDGIYNVSNFGRIKSLERLVRNGKSERIVKERILSQSNCKDGRNTVSLSFDNKAKSFPVNQLVYFSFNINSYYKKDFNEIVHIDKNPKNNTILNLKLVSSKESKQIALKLNKINFKAMNESNKNKQLEYRKLTHIICNCCDKKLTRDNFDYGRGKCKKCRNNDRKKLYYLKQLQKEVKQEIEKL